MSRPTTSSNTDFTASGAVTDLPQSLRRWLRWEHAIVLGLAIGFWVACLLPQNGVAGYGYRTDFLGVYVGARMVATGDGSLLYNVHAQRQIMDSAILPYHRDRLMAFIYPAYVAVLFRPLGALAFSTALRIWLLTNLVIALWTAVRLAFIFAGGTVARIAIVIAFLAWVPVQLTLFQGQLGILPTLGILEAMMALRSGHEWRAGVWLSLGLVKPQLVLFPLLVLMIWGRWRSLAAFVLALAGIVGTSTAAVGPWILKYLHFLAEYNRKAADLSLYPGAMQNWRGLVYEVFKTDKALASRSVLLLLSLVSILVVIGLCYIPVSRRTAQPESRFLFSFQEEGRYAIAVLIGLLSSPHLYMHDWVVAFPAGLVLWSSGRKLYSPRSPEKSQSGALLWLLAMAPGVFFAGQFGWSKLSSIQLAPLYVIALVTLAIAMLASRRTESRLPGTMSEQACRGCSSGFDL